MDCGSAGWQSTAQKATTRTKTCTEFMMEWKWSLVSCSRALNTNRANYVPGNREANFSCQLHCIQLPLVRGSGWRRNEMRTIIIHRPLIVRFAIAWCIKSGFLRRPATTDEARWWIDNQQHLVHILAHLTLLRLIRYSQRGFFTS